MQSTFFVIAHNIRSLHNVGSIFRTADAFVVTKLYLTGYTGAPPDPKISKVSLNAENTVPWEHNKSVVSVISKLRKQYPKIRIIGLENNINIPHLSSPKIGEELTKIVHGNFKVPQSFFVGSPPRLGGERGGIITLPDFHPRFPLSIILGEEVSGIPKLLFKLCDHFLEIPMSGLKESLNVSVAFGIAAYAIRNQT